MLFKSFFSKRISKVANIQHTNLYQDSLDELNMRNSLENYYKTTYGNLYFFEKESLKDRETIFSKGRIATHLSIEQLIFKNKELLQLIRSNLSISNESVEFYITPLIILLADYVSALPASEAYHHRDPGGLFRHSLETVKFALSLHVRNCFTNSFLPEEQIKVNEVYFIGVVVAALFHDIGKIISDFDIYATDPNSSKWNPLSCSLGAFLNHYKVSDFVYSYKTGRARRHECFAQIIIGNILPNKLKEYLLRYPDILEEVYEVLNAEKTSKLYSMIKKADSLSVDFDINNSVVQLNELTPHIDNFTKIIFALQYKIRKTPRVLNDVQGFLYIIEDNLYLSFNPNQFLNFIRELKAANIQMNFSNLIDFYKELIKYKIGEYADNTYGKVISKVYAVNENNEVFSFSGLFIKSPKYLLGTILPPAPMRYATVNEIKGYEINIQKLNRKYISINECLSVLQSDNDSIQKVVEKEVDILVENDIENNDFNEFINKISSDIDTNSINVYTEKLIDINKNIEENVNSESLLDSQNDLKELNANIDDFNSSLPKNSLEDFLENPLRTPPKAPPRPRDSLGRYVKMNTQNNTNTKEDEKNVAPKRRKRTAKSTTDKNDN
ncbi:MAG: TraI domain-containing protein [Succinivibrionaceae bacterium]